MSGDQWESTAEPVVGGHFAGNIREIMAHSHFVTNLSTWVFVPHGLCLRLGTCFGKTCETSVLKNAIYDQLFCSRPTVGILHTYLNDIFHTSNSQQKWNFAVDFFNKRNAVNLYITLSLSSHGEMICRKQLFKWINIYPRTVWNAYMFLFK